MAAKRRRTSKLISGPLWYKDAIIYELHVKAFMDSNDDGIGDIRGIVSKLDYLQSLGITAIWLLPFYPSPFRDDGYDIASYTSIHPAYGTLTDFKELLAEAHARNLRVITELVLNHTSDQHPWFQKSRHAKPGSRWRDFYVWSDTAEKYEDARIIFQDFETSNWTWDPVAKAYYWHRFYSHQPDLNYDNPRVHKAMLDAIDFWFRLGVDGLRLDAVPYLYERQGTNCENLPETHAFLKKLRAHVDKNFNDRMLLAEANQWSEDAVAYFGDGDECHLAFNFPVMPRMFMALQMEDRYPITEILDPPLEIPENAQWAFFLRNHDELTLEMVTDEERDYMYRMYADDPRAKINVGIRRRLAPLLSNNRRRIELLNMLLLSLPGTPVLYYGDEIGMGDNYYLGDRDGVRTPMQWTPDRNAGFSRVNPQRLYLPVVTDPEYHYEACNVDTQERNPSSWLWWMRRIIALRKRYRAFSRGTCEFLSPSNHRVLAFLRKFEDQVMLIVVNLSRFSQCVELDLAEYTDMVPMEVFSHNKFPTIRSEPYQITLNRHDCYWFELLPSIEETDMTDRPPVTIALEALPSDGLDVEVREGLERRGLLRYLKRSRWFGSKGRQVRSIAITETIRLPNDNLPTYLLLVDVEYNEGVPGTYQLPVVFALKDQVAELLHNHPRAIIANLEVDGQEGVIVDAIYEENFHQALLQLIARRRKRKGEAGELVSSRARSLTRQLKEIDLPVDSRVLSVEQSNSSILYDQHWVLKLYRRLEKGINPDAEIGRVLSETAKFAHIPEYKGSLMYRNKAGEQRETALLQEFVANQGDAWIWVLDHIGRFLEELLTRRQDLGPPPDMGPLQLDSEPVDAHEAVYHLIGDFQTEMFKLLGQRTGEMHRALAGITDNPDFAPEGFSQLYQRSVYQTMRNLLRSVLQTLQKPRSRFDAESGTLANGILEKQNSILAHYRRLLGKKIAAQKIRIHGDYHLGQVLFTGKDFVILDFEGEPARALSERRLKRSPLRDVAGMVRSFHYAVFAGLRRSPVLGDEDYEFIIPWLEAWYHYAATNFLRGYHEAIQNSGLLPKNATEANTLFEIFLLDKAVYELGYELNNRPDWITIPMLGIEEILAQSEREERR